MSIIFSGGINNLGNFYRKSKNIGRILIACCTGPNRSTRASVEQDRAHNRFVSVNFVCVGWFPIGFLLDKSARKEFWICSPHFAKPKLRSGFYLLRAPTRVLRHPSTNRFISRLSHSNLTWFVCLPITKTTIDRVVVDNGTSSVCAPFSGYAFAFAYLHG